MVYLLLAILTSTGIIIAFKLFPKFKIDNLQAISMNYFVAAVLGYLMSNQTFSVATITNSNWFLTSLLVGLTLIIGLNLFALCAQYTGVALTAIASRMAIIIPVLFGLLLFQDKTSVLKIAGIILALFAFYFTLKKKEKINIRVKHVYIPLFLFLAIGINDTLIKVAQHYFIGNDYELFLATAFLAALFLGLLVQLFRGSLGSLKFKLSSLAAGTILGTLNWFSTYYFLRGLAIFDVSYFVPVYYIGVVVLSSIIGFLIFKEKMRPLNWIGILLAMIAIFFIVWN